MRMPRFDIRTVVVVLLLAMLLPATANAQLRRTVAADGTTSAVVVKNRALIHTGQLLPLAKDGLTIAGTDDAGQQFDRVMQRLHAVLAAGGSSLRQIVKLNLYVVSDEVAAAVRKRISKVFGKNQPAIAIAVTPLPNPKALVAVDAVAATSRSPKAGIEQGKESCVIAPGKGRLIYISGQAQRGSDLPAATHKTVQELYRTLKILKAGPKHVVQIKTFLQPMKDVAKADREIQRLYPKGALPPVSHVQWTYRQIEIEMIAFVPYKPGEKPGREPLRFVTPPWMKASPVFSRIAVVESNELIYTSGLYGRGRTGRGEVRDIFAALKQITRKSGSDLQHLIKATYYVADPMTSRELNRLRPMLYDPKRPPAASKAGVSSVGLPRRSIMVDMIAVPKR